VNPLAVAPFFIYALVATLAPGQIDGRRRGRDVLLVEAVALLVAAVAGYLLEGLVEPRPAGQWAGRVALIAAVYLYVCGRGVVLVRAALDLPDLHLRRDDDRKLGAIEVARGRAIGALERAIALTLVVLGQYGALGLVVAAKALARYRALDDRDFAEYFLIGTLASLLLALLGGVALRALLY
jgi:hypothetical protein